MAALRSHAKLPIAGNYWDPRKKWCNMGYKRCNTNHLIADLGRSPVEEVAPSLGALHAGLQPGSVPGAAKMKRHLDHAKCIKVSPEVEVESDMVGESN
jgi:hypothetical protein